MTSRETFEEETVPILYKLFQKSEKEETLPNSFYGITIKQNLMSITTQENHKLALLSLDTKIPKQDINSKSNIEIYKK